MTEDFETLRATALNRILTSDSTHRVVVAGPGTGKTFLFKKICEQIQGNSLAITFINNLAHELEGELGQLAECGTFHALCKKLIYHLPVPRICKFSYFPKGMGLIEADRMILKPSLETLAPAFERFQVGDLRIKFYLERAHYYNTVGHTDGVFQVIRFLKSNTDQIPRYSQILVDEYQDFNQLEVEMINTLGTVSPTLIVGDDDQALYDFKHASPEFLRNLCLDSSIARFPLPYCSRCTEAIVIATNQIVQNATNKGFLRGRIDKPFECYKPGKLDDSRKYPKLIHAKCTVQKNNAPYVTRFVQLEIQRIVESGYKPTHISGTFDFIIAGPNHFRRGLDEALKSEFPNTFISTRTSDAVDAYDCYLELLRSRDSQIGWRGLISLYGENDARQTVEHSRTRDCLFSDLIPQGILDEANATLDALELLKNNQELDTFAETRLRDVFGVDLTTLRVKLGFAEEQQSTEVQRTGHTIRISSVLGCKGLTGNFVFLLGVNAGVLPRNAGSPTDYEICKFIVGLTRARKKCYLVSTQNLFGQWMNPSEFLSWIEPTLIEEVYVNKDYFTSLQEISPNEGG